MNIKRCLVALLACIMVLSNICAFAEESAIAKLSDIEKQIYDALLVMLNDFYNPASVRVMELTDYEDRSEYREKYAGKISDDIWATLARPDTVVIRLSGENRLGGTLNNYYMLCLSTWTTPCHESNKTYIKAAQLMGKSTLPYVGNIGDYDELDTSEIHLYTKWPLPDSAVGNINRALKEHWDILGF